MARRDPMQLTDRGRLAGLTRAALGTGLAGLTRLAGGSKKGVYRAVLDDGSAAIIYIWAAEENFWPARPTAEDPASPFAEASGLDLFLTAHARLAGLGVRTPRLYLADPSGRHYPADVAILEDIPGPPLEAVLRDDPVRAEPVVERLAAALRVMHACRAPGLGKVALVDGGFTAPGGPASRSSFRGHWPTWPRPVRVSRGSLRSGPGWKTCSASGPPRCGRARTTG
jgi:hypothetical protein